MAQPEDNSLVQERPTLQYSDTGFTDKSHFREYTKDSGFIGSPRSDGGLSMNVKLRGLREAQAHAEEEENTAEEQTDLLLDVAMTTAFASLLDGTPIQDARSLASFLSVFILVWWIWASHVAYNARYRQFNWPHRIFMFFQLLVFCAFAAFTNGFDIGNGIIDDTKSDQRLSMLRLQQGWTNTTINAENFRETRLPTLNVRGISMTMALSRILLLVQYLYLYAGTVYAEAINIRRNSTVSTSTGVGARDSGVDQLTVGAPSVQDNTGQAAKESLPGRISDRVAFYLQNGAILISAACYIAAFLVIGGNPSRKDQIVKIVLWYFPVVLEVGTHLFVSVLAAPESFIQEKYDARTFSARSATVFIIILGAGLDKITQGFHFMVGNLSFGPHRIGVIFCTTIVFILLFTLHFTKVPAPFRNDKKKRRRDPALFFLNFFYLSAVIITLQGMAAMLQVGNVGDSMQTAFQFLKESETVMNASSYQIPLNSTIYDDDTLHRLKTDGYDINAVLKYINQAIPDPSFQGETPLEPYQALLFASMDILAQGLLEINALPNDPDSLVTNEVYAFLDTNLTSLDRGRFISVAEFAINSSATPALWFSAAGGAVLVILAMMCLLDRWPPRKSSSGTPTALHRFAWGQIISRFAIGAILVTLVALDRHASTIVLDENYQYKGSRIWTLATQSWVLPPFALVLLIEQFWEYLLVYKARQNLPQPGLLASDASV